MNRLREWLDNLGNNASPEAQEFALASLVFLTTVIALVCLFVLIGGLLR